MSGPPATQIEGDRGAAHAERRGAGRTQATAFPMSLIAARRGSCLLLGGDHAELSDPEAVEKVAALHPGLDGAQETGRIGAVDDPMVVRQRQVHR